MTTAPLHNSREDWLTAPILAKVPAVTALFWLVKLLTTGMGEACSDWLGTISIVLAAGVGLLAFVVALWLQVRSDRYRPWTYWFAVAMVAVFGPMAADALHVLAGLGYLVTTVLCAMSLAVVLLAWRWCEASLSVHSITTRRRECFYWLTVLATFALGTATGDLTAAGMRLGYLHSIGLFAVAMLLVLLAWRLGLGETAAFWSAYVLTRPLGASLADWLGKPATPAQGKVSGLGWGDGPVTLGASVLIIALVALMARTGHGDPERSRTGDGGPTSTRQR